MTPSSLAEILTTALAILNEMAPEVRNRCADTTHLRLQGLIQSLDTAAGLAVAAPAEPAPAPAEPAPTLAAPIPADLVVILQDLASSLRELRADLDQVKAAPQG
jgi:hypothetical protein